MIADYIGEFLIFDSVQSNVFETLFRFLQFSLPLSMCFVLSYYLAI